MELIQGDRRVNRRYDIALELRYKVTARTNLELHGTGRTCNLSSGGILFETDQLLPTGTPVELSIYWPVLLHNASPMLLRVTGRIVRCDENGIAIQTTRYGFHTCAARVMEQPALQPRRTWLA